MTTENKGEKKISRRQFVEGAAVGVVVGAVAAGLGGYFGGVSVGKGQAVTTTAAVTSGPQQIIVGASTQLTGPEGPLGTQSNAVCQYEVNKINAQGGIYVKEIGYPMQVKYICLDDGSDISKTVANMNTLYTQDHVNFFIGSGGSVTSAQIQVAIEDNMVYIGGANDTPAEWAAAGTKTFAYFMQLEATGAAYPGPTAITPFFDWVDAQGSSGPKTVAVWEDDSTEGAAFAGPTSDTVTLAPNHGLDVVFQQKYETGSSDYTSLIEATKAQNPDVVIGIPQPPDLITLIKQSAQLGLSPKMWYMHKAPSSQQVLDALGPLAAGIVAPTLWAPSSPFGQDVAGAFIASQKYTPGWPPIAFSVSTDILWQAIGRAGTLDPTAVANELHNDIFYTTLGTVKFNPDGSFYPAPFMEQLTYCSTQNSLGENVGYNVTDSPLYPLTTGCCTSSTPPIVAGLPSSSTSTAASSS